MNWVGKSRCGRIGIAWNRNSEKLTLISRLLKVVQAVVGDEKV